MSSGPLEIKKDKRQLVLFSFGLALLLFDLLLLPWWHRLQSGPNAGKSPSNIGIAALMEKNGLSPRQAFFLNQPLAINHASAQELSLLPGIGEQLAERIVEFRDRRGQFHHPADLEKVQGIGRKTIHKLRNHLTFAEP